jgi:PAS domain-containing protein
MARPLELILARNLLSSLSTPAFLIDRDGDVVFYNEAAGAVLGRRYEETGPLATAAWTSEFGPFDEHGERLPWEDIPLTQALRGDRPAHTAMHIRDAQGALRAIEASGLPLVGTDGFHGAIVVFWETG